jgi:hypothetical protein
VDEQDDKVFSAPFQAPFSNPIGGEGPTNGFLREDGSFMLREDGGFLLRE